jgi:hypothetical protein
MSFLGMAMNVARNFSSTSGMYTHQSVHASRQLITYFYSSETRKITPERRRRKKEIGEGE